MSKIETVAVSWRVPKWKAAIENPEAGKLGRLTWADPQDGIINAECPCGRELTITNKVLRERVILALKEWSDDFSRQREQFITLRKEKSIAAVHNRKVRKISSDLLEQRRKFRRNVQWLMGVNRTVAKLKECEKQIRKLKFTK